MSSSYFAIQSSHLVADTKISLITSAKYRYEGTVKEVNTSEGTLTLKNVIFWGNEDRSQKNITVNNQKAPKVGTKFDSIIFWISNITKVFHEDDDKSNEFGDTAVVDAAISHKQTTNRFNWKYATDNQRKTTHFNNHQYKSSFNRYDLRKSATAPWMYDSYTKRKQWKPTSYVPIVSTASLQSNYKNAPYYKLVDSSHTIKDQQLDERSSKYYNRSNKPNTKHYFPRSINANRVLFYVPAEMNQSYYLNPVNYTNTKFKIIKSKQRSTKQKYDFNNLVDCSKPYDFESANAQLETELAKMNIKKKCVNIQQPSDIQYERTDSSTTQHPPTSVAHNGSSNEGSGDCLNGGITGNNENKFVQNSQCTNNPINLTEGKYYSREKSFYDQLSCPENAAANTIREKINEPDRNLYNTSSKLNTRLMGKKEKQLNMQTFGSIIVKSTFASRRKSTGNLPDMLISTTA